MTGTTGFPDQGGKDGGCAIPINAQAITATFTAVSPTNNGYIRAWAASESEPKATILHYATFNAGTGATVPIQPGETRALTVKNVYGPTHLVIDVTGYYVPQLHASIDSSANILYQSGRLVSATRTGPGVYVLTWDRDVSNCSVQASIEAYPFLVTVATNPLIRDETTLRVFGKPELAIDWPFHVTVSC